MDDLIRQIFDVGGAKGQSKPTAPTSENIKDKDAAEKERIRFFSLAAVKDPLVKKYGGLKTEKFCVYYLDKDCYVLNEVDFSGTVSSVEADPQTLLFGAVKTEEMTFGITSVVIVHNHPNGNPSPSSMDDLSTMRIADYFRLLGIKLYDHIIVGKNSVYSYFVSGRLEEINKKLLEQDAALNR